jgi:hypothetical protein
MIEKLKTLLLIILLVWGVAVTVESLTSNRLHLKELETQNQLIEVERSTKRSLQSQLESYNQQQIDLLALVQALDTNVKNLKYNLKTETKLVAAEPIVEFEILPASHSFDLANGLRVADFEASDTYKFTTYDLSFRSIVVATDQRASSTLQIKSSYDDTWIEVPHELEFNNLEAARQLFEPRIVLGGQLGVVPVNPAGFLGISFIHPSDSISIGTIGVGISNIPTLNLYPIDYNIGKPLPVLDDLHIAPGVSGSLPVTPNFVIGLWTTL